MQQATAASCKLVQPDTLLGNLGLYWFVSLVCIGLSGFILGYIRRENGNYYRTSRTGVQGLGMCVSGLELEWGACKELVPSETQSSV